MECLRLPFFFDDFAFPPERVAVNSYGVRTLAPIPRPAAWIAQKALRLPKTEDLADSL
ncbi:MAG: hypothetical protein M3494_04465 [Actinomycetota bacterium]|jgi:hypothetical protein|nr:hypothetical protein [Rubrobacter sp.]MDQ3507258.1 hypothetical protein [Actinomycetota bacterium]